MIEIQGVLFPIPNTAHPTLSAMYDRTSNVSDGAKKSSDPNHAIILMSAGV